ncbi:MAG: hypothetical protein LC776_00145 [Acidobacteria bacterium]|nr:hypothetical protein [Acidobacteriota bacterium]
MTSARQTARSYGRTDIVGDEHDRSCTGSVMGADSPDLARAKQLVDELKAQGFVFGRTAPGPDGPLMGRRMGEEWVDFVYLEGFSRDCLAWRQRRSPLVVPGARVMERRISGGAVAVLAQVRTWGSES